MMPYAQKIIEQSQTLPFIVHKLKLVDLLSFCEVLLLPSHFVNEHVNKLI